MRYLPSSFLIISLLLANPVTAMDDDDPLLSKIMVEQLEQRYGDDEDPAVIEGHAWLGKDLHKFWVNFEAEQLNSDLHELELQALYSRGLSAFWDMQIGLRHDVKEQPERSWLVLGLHGLAPYWLEFDSAIYVEDEGQLALEISAEYELLLSQRLILVPEVDMTFLAKDKSDYDEAKGLSRIGMGLRLRYEIRREIAPYIGFDWHKKYGELAGTEEEFQWLLGIRMWY